MKLRKGPFGFGLSICGGVDSHYLYPGLMRIKRLFPNETAFNSGQLDIGDLILAVNDAPLIGLKNYVSFFKENVFLITVENLKDIYYLLIS